VSRPGTKARWAALGAAALGAVVVVAMALLAWKPKTRAGAISAVRIAYVGGIASGPSRLTGASALVVRDGWLERELTARGVKLEWVPMPNANVGPMINEAFANRSIEFAGYGDLPSIIANAAGVRTKLIVPNGRGGDVYVVVRPESAAASVVDLKGKRIGVHRGRPWELPFARLVDSVGLKYDDFQVINLDPEAGAAALVAGKVDALVTLAAAFTLQDRGVAKILWSTADAPPDWKTLGGLFVSADFAGRQPEITQLVATAFVKANAWASHDENREAMIELASRNGLPPAVVRREYEKGSWRDRWSPLFDAPVIEHYQHAIAYAVDKHIIDHAYDFRESYDDRYVERAIGDLGLGGYWTPRRAN